MRESIINQLVDILSKKVKGKVTSRFDAASMGTGIVIYIHELKYFYCYKNVYFNPDYIEQYADDIVNRMIHDFSEKYLLK